MAKFLDYTQLQTFLNKLKEIFATKSVATTSADGLMAASDKTKLNGIANGATANTGTVTSVSIRMDGEVKGTITTEGTIDLGSLAAVAKSGSYNDLHDKPTIPEPYTLPTASASQLGGVKVDGTTITINNGVISSSGGGISYDVIGTL